jgi:predicted ribonuclease YlaK
VVKMTQKLVIFEKETRKELIEAIRKEIDKGLIDVKGLSVLKGLSSWEAWVIIDDKEEQLAGFE